MLGYKSNRQLTPSPLSSRKRHHRSNSTGTRLAHNTSSSTNVLGELNGSDEVSVGSGGSDAGYHAPRTPQNMSLSSLLESVLCGLEEPRGIIK